MCLSFRRSAITYTRERSQFDTRDSHVNRRILRIIMLKLSTRHRNGVINYQLKNDKLKRTFNNNYYYTIINSLLSSCYRGYRKCTKFSPHGKNREKKTWLTVVRLQLLRDPSRVGQGGSRFGGRWKGRRPTRGIRGCDQTPTAAAATTTLW